MLSRIHFWVPFVAPVDVFTIYAPADFTGRNFLCTATLNGTQVNNANWSIVSGNQYATINQYGRVDLLDDGSDQAHTITVQATYGNNTDRANIIVTYAQEQLTIQCADTITGTTGNVFAIYNGQVVGDANWSIISGEEHATIDPGSGNIDIISSGQITIQAEYQGQYGPLVTTKVVNLVYNSNTSTETIVDPETGQTTTTTTTETTDPETGATTTTTTTETTNEDGSSSQTNSETTTNQDGSSSTSSTTTNADGSSSETQSNTSAPDPTTGSTTTNTTTTNYDENGDTTGSQESEHIQNTDGSSTTTTTNYDAEGDPTNGTNNEIDTNGNSSTQNIDYDENGDPTVTGYDIDTSGSQSGEKTFNEEGVNTEFKAFDVTDGFVLHIHFTIDFTNQPANQDEDHHNILTMKRPTPEPWYGFQLRQSSTNKYIQLGTQFATGGNTNTTINPSNLVGTIGEYDIEITYNPLATTNKFVAKNLITGTNIYTSNNTFPDIAELEYLSVCIGCAQDANGNPFRYSNIDVSEFSLMKLSKTLVAPTISCDGQHITLVCETPHSTIYYKLNHSGNYIQYSSPITINADTFVESYSELNGNQSEVVSMNCVYVEPISDPTITCDGEQITLSCDTQSAAIYYKLDHSGNYVLYEHPIEIFADTFIETYAELNGRTSNVVSDTCIYIPTTLIDPVISCDGKFITITCVTQGADIYYQLDQAGGFILYDSPIEIFADTFVEAYSELHGSTSNIVSQNCIYDPTHDYSQDYLTLRILTSGDVIWKSYGTGSNKTIEYSINDEPWNQITATTSGINIPVNAGDVVRFRGNNNRYCEGNKANYSGFDGCTATYDVEGNIHSMLYGDNFIGNDNLTNTTYHFTQFFKQSGVVSAENLILPATTLKNYCYRALFSLASHLITPPQLPATTLAQGCYWYLFERCPIQSAPELPAPILVRECYGYMFTGCSSLNYIKCLATSGFDQNQCTQGWVNNVSRTGTFVKDGNTTWATGANGIPTNWVVQND